MPETEILEDEWVGVTSSIAATNFGAVPRPAGGPPKPIGTEPCAIPGLIEGLGVPRPAVAGPIAPGRRVAVRTRPVPRTHLTGTVATDATEVGLRLNA